MPNLQKFIRDHQSEFDDAEPSAGHFDRFAARLDALPVTRPVARTRSQMLKIAALILVLISVSVMVFDLATREIRDRFAMAKQGSELPLEIREAVQYYDNQSGKQMATLQSLTANHADAVALNASALKEIRSLDATTNELKKSLTENPGNERILDAIIQNQQMKETMLNNIITQLSPSKK
ncbi:MAG: hypothetical protein WCK09_03610 [Bacteroidota bacterium]